MKIKWLLVVIALFVVALSTSAATGEWREVQTVEIPKGTPVYYMTTDPKLKFYIKIYDLKVPVSKTNAIKFANGEIRLELVKWQSVVSGKYRYTTRKLSANSRDIDLSEVFL